MTQMHAVAAAISSWIVALLALFGVYHTTIMAALGFVLIVARLIQEIPAAYKAIRGTKNKDTTHGSD